jgi:hypothetical protein
MLRKPEYKTDKKKYLKNVLKTAKRCAGFFHRALWMAGQSYLTSLLAAQGDCLKMIPGAREKPNLNAQLS